MRLMGSLNSSNSWPARQQAARPLAGRQHSLPGCSSSWPTLCLFAFSRKKRRKFASVVEMTDKRTISLRFSSLQPLLALTTQPQPQLLLLNQHVVPSAARRSCDEKLATTTTGNWQTHCIRPRRPTTPIGVVAVCQQLGVAWKLWRSNGRPACVCSFNLVRLLSSPRSFVVRATPARLAADRQLANVSRRRWFHCFRLASECLHLDTH